MLMWTILIELFKHDTNFVEEMPAPLDGKKYDGTWLDGYLKVARQLVVSFGLVVKIFDGNSSDLSYINVIW